MVKYADVIVGYSTYPHIDMYETGSKVFDLIIKKSEKKISTILCIKLTFHSCSNTQDGYIHWSNEKIN